MTSEPQPDPEEVCVAAAAVYRVDASGVVVHLPRFTLLIGNNNRVHGDDISIIGDDNIVSGRRVSVAGHGTIVTDPSESTHVVVVTTATKIAPTTAVQVQVQVAADGSIGVHEFNMQHGRGGNLHLSPPGMAIMDPAEIFAHSWVTDWPRFLSITRTSKAYWAQFLHDQLLWHARAPVDDARSVMWVRTLKPQEFRRLAPSLPLNVVVDTR